MFCNVGERGMNHPKKHFGEVEPTSFMGLGWFKMAFFNNVDPFWSFDHFDSQEGWFKVFLLLTPGQFSGKTLAQMDCN